MVGTHNGSPLKEARRHLLQCGGSLETDRDAPSTPRYAGFQVVDVSVQDSPEPHGPVAGHPAIR
jgi:hypothetical protein